MHDSPGMTPKGQKHQRALARPVTAALCRRTWLERGPVRAPDELLVGGKGVLEREGERRRTVSVQMRQPPFRFIDTGHMAFGNPPQGGVGAGKFLEPRMPLPQHFDM